MSFLVITVLLLGKIVDQLRCQLHRRIEKLEIISNERIPCLIIKYSSYFYLIPLPNNKYLSVLSVLFVKNCVVNFESLTLTNGYTDILSCSTNVDVVACKYCRMAPSVHSVTRANCK